MINVEVDWLTIDDWVEFNEFTSDVLESIDAELTVAFASATPGVDIGKLVVCELLTAVGDGVMSLELFVEILVLSGVVLLVCSAVVDVTSVIGIVDIGLCVAIGETFCCRLYLITTFPLIVSILPPVSLPS